jgi:hypothetical protein
MIWFARPGLSVGESLRDEPVVLEDHASKVIRAVSRRFESIGYDLRNSMGASVNRRLLQRGSHQIEGALECKVADI